MEPNSPEKLFSSALTFPKHENDDIHFIGEALPTPSQVTDVTINGVSDVGASSIPAREDHEHTVDLSNYYTKAEADIIHDDINTGGADLSNYYTKAQVDALIAGLGGTYYTETEINTILGDYYTSAEVDALIPVVPIEIAWSFGQVVNPASATSLNRYIASRAFTLDEFNLTLVLDSNVNIEVKLYHDDGVSGPVVIKTTTLTAGNFTVIGTIASPVAIAVDDILYPIISAAATGDGEVLSMFARGTYD